MTLAKEPAAVEEPGFGGGAEPGVLTGPLDGVVEVRALAVAGVPTIADDVDAVSGPFLVRKGLGET